MSGPIKIDGHRELLSTGKILKASSEKLKFSFSVEGLRKETCLLQLIMHVKAKELEQQWLFCLEHTGFIVSDQMLSTYGRTEKELAKVYT